MRRLILTMLAFALYACGNGSGPGSSAGDSTLDAVLEANDDWPYATIGILDIVEAGYGDSDDPEWAVGSLITRDDEFGIGIEIDGSVISRAGIDIDSGREVRVWLAAPKIEYGVKTYRVSRIEPL